jgi:hypothetical protein
LRRKTAFGERIWNLQPEEPRGEENPITVESNRIDFLHLEFVLRWFACCDPSILESPIGGAPCGQKTQPLARESGICNRRSLGEEENPMAIGSDRIYSVLLDLESNSCFVSLHAVIHPSWNLRSEEPLVGKKRLPLARESGICNQRSLEGKRTQCQLNRIESICLTLSSCFVSCAL